MSPRSECITALKERGYRMFKCGSKHQLWTNGVHKILLSSGSGVSSVNVRNFMADLKRHDKELATMRAVHSLAGCLNGAPCPECQQMMAAWGDP